MNIEEKKFRIYGGASVKNNVNSNDFTLSHHVSGNSPAVIRLTIPNNLFSFSSLLVLFN